MDGEEQLRELKKLVMENRKRLGSSKLLAIDLEEIRMQGRQNHGKEKQPQRD